MTGRDSRPIPDKKGGHFIERIKQGAFAKAVKRAEKVNALLNHDWSRVLADTDGALTVKEDVIGLRAHLETDDAEVVKLAKERRLRGWSFDIRNAVEERAEREGDLPLRTITDFDISEISLISDKMRPWYDSTTVETRAGENGEEIIELRAEEFEAEYIGFEDKRAEEKPDLSKLEELIKKYGGKTKEKR